MKNLATMAGFKYDLMIISDSGLIFGPPCKRTYNLQGRTGHLGLVGSPARWAATWWRREWNWGGIPGAP